MKKTLLLLLALTMALAFPLGAYAIVAQSPSFYVNDGANVLSPATEELITSTNPRLEQQCSGAQIVVVSVDYMDGYNADEYAYSLMNDWGVGSSDLNNGMLLLFATRENKGWLAVGEGIYGEFDDDAAGMYLDQYFWDEYDAQNYDEGVTALFNALVKWYDDYYNTAGTGEAQPEVYAPSAGTGSAQPEVFYPSYPSLGGYYGFQLFDTIFRLIFVVALVAIWSALRCRRRWGRWGVWPFYYFSPWWATRRRFYRDSMLFGSGYDYRRGPFYGRGNTPYSNRSPGGFSSGRSSGFGGSGRSGGFSSGHSSGFGGGMGRGGGGHSGGGAGRR